METSPTASQTPGTACTYRELLTAEELAERLADTGRPVMWRSLWVTADPALHCALVALLATLLGLVSLEWPIPMGLALTLLLAVWSLELGGIASLLSRLATRRATQDVIAEDPRGSTGAGSIMLLVRADLPRNRPTVIAALSSRSSELAWLVIVLTLFAVAGRALGWQASTLGYVQLVPAMLALVLLATALIGSWAPPCEPVKGWSGIDQALAAAEVLDREETVIRRITLAVVGASDLGGTARILDSDPTATAACRCWEFESGRDVIEALAGPPRSEEDRGGRSTGTRRSRPDRSGRDRRAA